MLAFAGPPVVTARSREPSQEPQAEHGRPSSSGAALLVMSSTVEEAHPQQALDAGAAGILDKIALPEEQAAQIRAVRDG